MSFILKYSKKMQQITESLEKYLPNSDLAERMSIGRDIFFQKCTAEELAGYFLFNFPTSYKKMWKRWKSLNRVSFRKTIIVDKIFKEMKMVA